MSLPKAILFILCGVCATPSVGAAQEPRKPPERDKISAEQRVAESKASREDSSVQRSADQPEKVIRSEKEWRQAANPRAVSSAAYEGHRAAFP